MKSITQAVLNLKDVSPNPKTNQTFSNLVEWVVANPTAPISLSKKKLFLLQKKCALAEYELEKYWSTKDITKFPYYQNYLDLAKLEWESFQSCYHPSKDKRKVLFIGSGPIPFTAIILAQKYGVSSLLIDTDDEAVRLSTNLIKKLNLSHKISIQKISGQEFQDYDKYGIIYLAALAGIASTEKLSILKKIYSLAKPHTHILCRSSWGSRKLLYKPLSSTVKNYFKPIIEIRPHNHIINSFLVFEKI